MDDEEAQQVVERMQEQLKKRGAQGIRGLARNFKICDRDGSKKLDVPELAKCCSMCKLGLGPDEVEKLHAYFDADKDGLVSLDEFIRGIRGRLSPVRRKLVTKVFNALDSAGDKNGFLTIDDIAPAYNCTNHPEVKAGKKTEKEVLSEFLEGFEGGEQYKDRNGVVTLDEWIKYYEELSSSIDSDDYFGQMVCSTWSALKTKLPNGQLVNAITYVPASQISQLEQILKKAIYQKTKGVSEMRTLEEAFKQFDADKSGQVTFKEFRVAMERFGLHAAGETAGMGGIPLDVLQGLFDRYDTDASGVLTYKQFSMGLLGDEASHAANGNGANPALPSLAQDGIRPQSSLGNVRPSTASLITETHARVRSIANPPRPSDPNAFKKSSNIFG